ncbi:unnamed protein product [Orchesella dallaii]|uniref:Gustatory receptor n=1 Tax=Orchesella dallaii TaxID=48710 RepID=A0ABP1RBE6_9HEXA
MSHPSHYQMRVLNTLAIIGLSQVQITRTPNGFFKIRTSEPWKRILYVILRINTGLKFLFLVLVSSGAFQSEFEFFEKMAILLWFLILLLLTISERLFYRKYPFFEILTAWWKTQDAVFNGLGKPDQFTKDIRKIGHSRVWFQGIVAMTGILAVVIQYDAAPKYCTFLYSLLKEESEALKWLTGVHEILFLSHAWLILRSPDADFLAVMFFAEDMMVCMYMLFRCFKSMAFVYPSTVDFIQQFKNFLSTPQINPYERAMFHKLRPTIRPTEFRFGPCKVGPWTVGMAMDVLLQYYICVALW